MPNEDMNPEFTGGDQAPAVDEANHIGGNDQDQDSSVNPEGNANSKGSKEVRPTAFTVSATPPKPKVCMSSYQTKSDFVVSLMVKNLKKEEVSVEFESENFTVHAKLPDGSDYEKEFQCARKINPENCRFKVMSTKVEIHLRKLECEMWPTLEEFATNELKPYYPSSSTKKKDWDKVEYEIKKQEEEEPAPDVNGLLEKIYKYGDENTKRAMIKSMQESNGTVLSVNWEKVGRRPVEISPPEGMEYRKWN